MQITCRSIRRALRQCLQWLKTVEDPISEIELWDSDDDYEQEDDHVDKKELQKMLTEAVRMSKEALVKNGIANEQAILSLAKVVLQRALREYEISELLFENDGMTPMRQLCYEKHRDKWLQRTTYPWCSICKLTWDETELRFADVETKIAELQKNST